MLGGLFGMTSEHVELRQQLLRLERKVDSILAHLGIDWQAQLSDLDSEIIDLMRQRQKIEAIKLYRANTGAGLVEAKSHVESLPLE